MTNLARQLERARRNWTTGRSDAELARAFEADRARAECERTEAILLHSARLAAAGILRPARGV